MQTLVILDFGSQYTQLIARRARELNVHSIILPFSTSIEKIAELAPLGIILSGGPNSVYDEGAPDLNEAILNLEVPILGICYGMQLLAQHLGGTVEASSTREYGKATLKKVGESVLLDASFDRSTIWMSHGTHVIGVPEGFSVTAKSGDTICAIEDPVLGLFGLQFHPEVVHSEYGRQILENFIELCHFTRDWTAESIIEQQIETIRATVGTSKVICALSGGVDSSIAATLVDRAIGDQQICIFVDNGLLRQNEYDEVLAVYKTMGLQVKPIRAAKLFLDKLKGVTDPEQKRKIIGGEFIRIFEREAKAIKGANFLVQGTLYPDVIESVAVHGSSVVIKSHHNVGGLPEKMQLKLIEPLRETFKDEVRVIGATLGLPESIVQRQAFPGPGLGVRIVGEITPERVVILQQADAIVREEIERLPEIRKDLFQYFAVLLPVKSVGVMGDQRTYEYAVVIKAFHSDDIMTTDWARLPYDLLATMSSRIVSQVHGINRVVYEITTKPPATVEWE
ncbi:MAG: synthase, large subunit [Candidatus Saccharibacteria bacterium]|nr:synthase, large subunit [Candidatus Saccharibacteria bacterium]